jgi:pimeloyl-ACP methyl ester carboxylesterase
MPGLSISPPEVPAVPAEAINNSWRVYRETDSVIVFVHGVLSNSDACWRNEKARSYWPDLVLKDRLFDDSSVYLGGYYTAFDSTVFTIADCARELLSALIAADQHPAVIEAQRIVFVCHSLGGIVTRYMLERWRERFRQKKIALLLIASPSIGAKYANRLENLLAVLQHETGRQLGWKSPDLVDLDRRFRDLMEQNLIPDLMGRELCEHRFPIYRRWLAPILNRFPPVVELDSAGRYFGDARRLPDTNHSSAVKPDSDKHCAHVQLREFYSEVVRRFPVGNPTLPQTIQRFPDPRGRLLARDRVLRCARMNWDVEVNEDGDARDELALQGVVDCRSGSESKYAPPPMWVQSGHLSRYAIDSSRSSPRVIVESEELQPRLVRSSIAFHHPPSEREPAQVLLQNVDFNVFAMDAEEFRRKESAQQDDTDFVQKSIRWEQVGELNMVVRFPAAMELEADAFVEAYQLFHGDTEDVEVFDEHLTASAREQFYFSRLTRVAVLRFRNPLPWTAYRFVWRLGRRRGGAETSPAGEAIIAQRRSDLLGIRKLFSSAPEGAGADAKKAVLKAMAGLGAFVVDEVHRRTSEVDPDAHVDFDEGRLELNLLAVDVTGSPEHEILRKVGGTDASLNTWEVALTLGDGIAGRAAKRLEPRVYDRANSDPLSDGAYLAMTNRHHEWLLAIPLWDETLGAKPYGVVNIGTFDANLAVLLRTLDNPESIELLLEYANDEFLSSVLRARRRSNKVAASMKLYRKSILGDAVTAYKVASGREQTPGRSPAARRGRGPQADAANRFFERLMQASADIARETGSAKE